MRESVSECISVSPREARIPEQCLLGLKPLDIVRPRLRTLNHPRHHAPHIFGLVARLHLEIADARLAQSLLLHGVARGCGALIVPTPLIFDSGDGCAVGRSEEHTSELQSLMRISYAVFCLKKKNI